MENENHLLGKSRFFSFNENAQDSLDTNLYATFIVHDFNRSWNGQVITEEECLNNMKSLLNKPVLVEYFNEGDKSRDHLGGHGDYITKNRDTGEDIIATDTFAIGTFTNVYVDEVKIDGESVRCFLADAVLWKDRYYNVCSLIKEWFDKGIDIFCSCEYIFYNFEVNNGVQYIKSPFSYEGHTILNSELKDEYDIAYPAYDSSRFLQFNSAVGKDIEKNKSENEMKEEGMVEVENIFVKSLNDISLGDIRDKIMLELEKIMMAKEYNYMWLSNYGIYDEYFLYETYIDDEWKTFKVNYVLDADGNLLVDMDSKIEVKYKTILVPVEKVEEAISSKEAEITALNSQLEGKEASIDSLTKELTNGKEKIVSLSTSINELNEKISSLNTYKEKMEEEKLAQILNEQKESFKAKFVALNALDLFESDEVQEQLKYVADPEKSVNAKLALMEILLQAIPDNKSKNSKSTVTVFESAKSLNNLNGTKPVVNAAELL